MSTKNALNFYRPWTERQRIEGDVLKPRDHPCGNATTFWSAKRSHFRPPSSKKPFYLRLTQCQEAEQADQLKEFKAWVGFARPELSTGPRAAANAPDAGHDRKNTE